MILILGDETDPNILRIAPKLDQRGVDYCVFNPQRYPREAGISIRFDRAGTPGRILRHNRREIDLNAVKSVWYLGRARPIPDPAVGAEYDWWIAAGCERWIAELWECLDCLWLPDRPVSDREPYRAYNPRFRNRLPEQPLVVSRPTGHNKLHQLAVARSFGFAIPRTLVTNEPGDFLRFHEECGGRLISKSLFKVRATRYGEPVYQSTFRLDRRSARRYRSIRYAPAIYQEEVPKQLELRVTVVGRKVFAAAIRSQESFRLSGDWRRPPEFDVPRYYSPYTLPAGIEKRCVDVTEALGLNFGAMDLVLTPEGEFVFLETNPRGQWIFVEDYTGLPIGDAIVDFLCDGDMRSPAALFNLRRTPTVGNPPQRITLREPGTRGFSRVPNKRG